MFVRKKANKTGSVSVQAIEKTKGGDYKVRKTFGCSSDPAEIELLYRKARQWVRDQKGPSLFPDENLYELNYITPYSIKAKSVMLKTEHDDEVDTLMNVLKEGKS